jgi:uncharacterized protein YgiM (DUF1202 family)
MTIICLCGCGRTKQVRKADFKRGWGMFFSKSCKAKWQERCTGQHRSYLRGEVVSSAAKMRGEDPSMAVDRYVDKHRVRTVDGIKVDHDYMGITDQEHDEICNSIEMGWDGHKNWL